MNQRSRIYDWETRPKEYTMRYALLLVEVKDIMSDQDLECLKSGLQSLLKRGYGYETEVRIIEHVGGVCKECKDWKVWSALPNCTPAEK